MSDEHHEVPFEIGIETTNWTFDNGDYLTIETNTSGYFLYGRVGGNDLHDDDHEDFYFPDTDSLLGFLEQHGLLTVLTKKGGIAKRIEPLVEDAERWRSRPDSVHERICHACGNKAIHADNITPYVTCRECGSNDTRRKRDTP